jgi:hypothetical protein
MRDPYHDRICTATDAMVIVTTNAQLYQEKWDPTSIVFNATLNYIMERVRCVVTLLVLWPPQHF